MRAVQKRSRPPSGEKNSAEGPWVFSSCSFFFPALLLLPSWRNWSDKNSPARFGCFPCLSGNWNSLHNWRKSFVVCHCQISYFRIMITCQNLGEEQTTQCMCTLFMKLAWWMIFNHFQKKFRRRQNKLWMRDDCLITVLVLMLVDFTTNSCFAQNEMHNIVNHLSSGGEIKV